jgi:hypothetical protein
MKQIIITACFIVCFTSYSIGQMSQEKQCDTTNITYDYTDNPQDTTKAYFTHCADADTTESYFDGYVFDSKTYQPIENAIVVLLRGGVEYSDTTKSDGKFIIQEFAREDSCSFIISHSRYHCLTVNFKACGNLDEFNIKLLRKK